MHHEQNEPGTLAALLHSARFGASIDPLSRDETERMAASQAVLDKTLMDGRPVYGVTRGFGPLVAFEASDSAEQQGAGLISHLGTGQGEPLGPETSRLVFRLRLQSMRRGYSAISPECWDVLARLWNSGFTPVIPRDGTVSASGDLQPLAHAALALAGRGEAWVREGDAWSVRPSAEVLRELGLAPVDWNARQALAFVNGTSVGLAVTMVNHAEVLHLTRALASLTARAVVLLGANPEAYHAGLGHARGQVGQLTAARWIRSELAGAEHGPDRPLQEPYSLRCAPQVLGAVLDQLWALEDILVREATGTTDNPVCYEGELLHGGNFHAMPVGLASDQLGLCLQQVAYLADRQLALLCTPATNGERAPMLTPNPGVFSGLAGVQLSATSFVSRIRQLVYPASLTTLPTNGGNQDHVPMALNGANAVGDALDLAWLVAGSLAAGLNQLASLTERGSEPGGLWATLADRIPPLDEDRPMAPDVRAARAIVREHAQDTVRADGGDDGLR
ncbi:aromatic amino acid lyase [Nocardiopsis sp. MG754419]|nr:aromatic amino acid lyase [Nocardiopsis sp. MG754419]